MQNVAILHNVVLALNKKFTLLLAGLLGTEGYEIVILHNLSTNEPALQVGMNYPCSLRSRHSLLDGPCTNFLWSNGKECLHVEQGVRGPDKLVYPGFGKSHIGKEGQPIILILEFGNFSFQLSGYNQYFGLLVFKEFPHLVNIVVTCYCRLVIYVANVYDRFS